MGHALQCFKVLHHEHCKIYLLLLLLPKQYHLAASHFQSILWHPTHFQPQVVSTHHFYHKESQQHNRLLHQHLWPNPTSCWRNAYLTLVCPVLKCATIIWDPHMQQEINMLEYVQRNAVHFIAKDYRSTTPGFITGILRKHELTTLQERQLQLRLGFFYEVVEGLVPAITLCDFITPQKPGRRICSTRDKSTYLSQNPVKNYTWNDRSYCIPETHTDQYHHSILPKDNNWVEPPRQYHHPPNVSWQL